MDSPLEICDKPNEFSIEDIKSRHRRERKELQSQIQVLKKNAPKTDKKKRKEALEQISKLETELQKNQLDEIKRVEEGIKCLEVETLPEESTAGIPYSLKGNQEQGFIEGKLDKRLTKAQKRREKKERMTRQRDEDIRAFALNDIYALKAVETEKIISKLKHRHLNLFDIPSDGDCLYNAVRHQLLQKGLTVLSIYELRTETSNYIKKNKESLIPYMIDTESGNLLTDEEFEKYCNDIRENCSWGGEIELKALSSILKTRIEVLQGEGSPTLHGVEFGRTLLTITYHRHLYSLGEHYNSTVPEEDEAA